MDFTISQSEVDTTALPQVDFEMASTFDCSSWQGNGTWTRQVTMLQEIDGYLHNTNMEESGSITNNLVTVELRQGQIDADGQSWIIVYGEGKVNTYTIIDGQTYNWPVVWLEDSLAEAENFVPYTIDLGYF